MQKVPPRKQKQLQASVPKLKIANDFTTDPTANKDLSNRLNLQNMQKSIMTTSSQFQTNSQTSLTASRRTSVTSSQQVRNVVKSNLDELQNNISEMKSINMLRRSIENLVDEDEDDPKPLVTFPDDTPVPSEIGSPNIMDSYKIEQKTMNNIRTTKVITDGYSAEKASAKFAESKSVQSGDMSYEENNQAAATHAKLEMDGISAEKSLVKAQEARSLITAEKTQQESKNMAHSSVKVTTDTFSAENTATEAQQERQMVSTTSGIFNSKLTSSSQSNITFTSTTKGIHTSSSSKLTTAQQVDKPLEEEQCIGKTKSSSQHSQEQDIQQQLFNVNSLKGFKQSDDNLKIPKNLREGQAIADGNCFYDSFRQGLEQSDDNLKLPKNMKVGQAIADGNCFFDSFRQGLEQQLGIKVTIDQLRQYCKEFAQNNPPEWFINAIANSHDNNGMVRIETPNSYTGNIVNSNRWGDSEVEGRILCEKYRIKLHIIEKHNLLNGNEVRTDQIIESRGSKSVNNIVYNEKNTIHIVNRGYGHFEPVLNIQEIEHYEQTKFNKRQGTSGISRQLYEIELIMLFLLQGVTRKDNRQINNFYLATNIKEAGDFDGVVFKYKYNENGVKKSKVVCLHAKHKDTDKNEKDTKGKENNITIDTLLSQSEKGDFLLRKFLSSYRKIKQLRLNKNHLIFKDDLERCDFMIYTNAVFNFDESSEEKYVEKKYIEPGDILNLKACSKEGDFYYKLIPVKKIMDALRHSLDYEILVKELAQSFSLGSIDGNKSIFKDYQASLAERVIKKNNQREGRLRDDFLGGDQDKEFSSAILEEIKKKKPFTKKSVNELKEELGRKTIQLPNKFGSIDENALKLPLPCKLFSDEEIKEFLSELKLFHSQPDESRLGEVIKDKIKQVYTVEEQDIDSVFSNVEYKVRKWWKEGNEYLTESNTFFQESARVSIKFDVKEPVILFTGRIKQLDDLHKILKNGGEAVISQMVSVTGLGGIGKSELARKYISIHSKDYDDNVIWINADNYLTIAESFRRLAADKLRISTTDENRKEKDITRIVKEAYRFFAKRNRKSLFVFDNVGKYKMVKQGDEGIDKFLPSGPNKPSVLITSRDQEWGLSVAQLLLDVFTEEEAVEFIRKSIGIEDHSQESEIRSLAKELQYFPLALQQVVAYIKKENQGLSKSSKEKFTVSNYLELYKEKAEELLNTAPGETYDRYTKTVLTTWEITINKIKQKQGRGTQAIVIFEIIAYLAPDKIPVEGIFSNLANSEDELHSAVELLDQYSMAKLEQGVLNIHRLVQQVTRIKLVGQNKEKEILRYALTLLKEPLANSDSSFVSIYATHAVSAWDYTSIHNMLVIEFSKLPELIMQKLITSTRYEETCLFGKRVSQLLTSIIGPWHEDTVAVRYITSNGLFNYGKFEEALKIGNEVYEKIKEKLGDQHFTTLDVQEFLAQVLIKLGKYNKALQIINEVLLGLMRYLPPHHPFILEIMRSKGRIFSAQGKYKLALKIYNKIYEIQRKIGADTLFIREAIARTLCDLGKVDEAVQIFDEDYGKWRDIYGPDHPFTLDFKNNMAAVFYKNGRYNEAFQTFSEAYEIRKRKNNLASDHPETLQYQINLAAMFNHQGKYDEALAVNNEAYKKLDLGSDHPVGLYILYNRAYTLLHQGKHKQALQIYMEVFEKSKMVLGVRHPFTLHTQHDAAIVLFQQRKFDEAVKICQRVYKLRIEILGSDHPATIKDLIFMSSILSTQGKYDESHQKLYEAYRRSKDIFGANHPYTSSARHLANYCGSHLKLPMEKNIGVIINRTPLHLAAFAGYREIVSCWVFKQNIVLPTRKSTSLHLSVTD